MPEKRQASNNIKAIRAKLVRAEQNGFSKRTPEEIRQAVKARLKQRTTQT